MVAAARIAEEMGHASPSLTDQLASCLEAWNVPSTCPPFSVEAIWEAMSHDKKRQGKRLRWVLPHAVGRVETSDQVPKNLVLAVLRQMGAEEN
jgi:3-dehydroquinate synthetase